MHAPLRLLVVADVDVLHVYDVVGNRAPGDGNGDFIIHHLA